MRLRPLLKLAEEAAAPAAATTEDPELKALKLLNGDERRWRKIVHRGLIDGTAYPVIDATVQPFSVSNWDKTTVKASSNLANGEFELVFFEDGKVHDGRFANNGWLQETPNGITKLTWDNAALVSPKTARKLGLVEEDVVTIKSGDQSIEAAVSVLPGTTYRYSRTRVRLRSNRIWCRWWFKVARNRQPRG